MAISSLWNRSSSRLRLNSDILFAAARVVVSWLLNHQQHDASFSFSVSEDYIIANGQTTELGEKFMTMLVLHDALISITYLIIIALVARLIARHYRLRQHQCD